MASQNSIPSLDCYDTALCIIPPKSLWPPIDHLRSAYDPVYKEWPPHINIAYPFVPIQSLPRASELIVSRLQEDGSFSEFDMDLQIRLQSTGHYFDVKKNKVTFFVHDQYPKRVSQHERLRRLILESLHATQTSDVRQLYMTVGQGIGLYDPLNDSVIEKATQLPTTAWRIDKLYILIRKKDTTHFDRGIFSQMKVWGEIDLGSLTLLTMRDPIGFYEAGMTDYSADDRSTPAPAPASRPLTRLPYTFCPTKYKWQQIDPATQQVESAPESFTVSSYNVQAEFQYPPTRARYPIIVQNLLDGKALADILVLQEITDDFLSFLCKDIRIRENYPFVSNGPSDQTDIEPLPDHTNVVVLSKWPFSWDSLSLPISRKGSVIVRFSNIGKQEGGVFMPTILSALHFTSGFTDTSIEKKKIELEALINYLSKEYKWNPWILAGDFNIPTSLYTIEKAVKRKEINLHSRDDLSEFEMMLIDSNLVDAWTFSRVRYGDLPEPDGSSPDFDALGGEQGATFDPTANGLAADTVPDNLSWRPQRYDRILVRADAFTVTGFNMFGQSKRTLEADLNAENNSDASSNGQMSYGSDHWGIRCSLCISAGAPDQPPQIGNSLMPVEPDHTLSPLADILELTACLSQQSEFPSDIDIATRESALNLLKEVILQDKDSRNRGLPPYVIVPVGSYGLGVWSTTSDIDCLCIGPISPDLFFALAIQRLRKASSRGVKIFRRVDAQPGTILELGIGHIKVDLRYCSAASIAETWPDALTLPPTDPAFRLPAHVLAKLKPIRDLYHMRRTVPDLAAFRLAYRLIKCWATRRGIYAAKFGYLSGIQISILLTRVCKLLSHNNRPASTPTLIATFFTYYAGFDWKRDTVSDPFYYKHVKYVRTAQEPMAILGFHGPSVNTAQAATASTVHVISREFKRAESLLCPFKVTWSKFLGEDTGAMEFLKAYKTYVKITAQFWGVSLERGNSFVAWLESRCVPLLVDLSKQVAHMHPRIWPARFVNQDASEDDSEYEGYYLIGLEMGGSKGKPTTKEELRAAVDRIHAAVSKFEAETSADTKHFDPRSCWMGTAVLPRSRLGGLRLDSRDWGKYTAEAEDDDLGDSAFWASIEAEQQSEPQARKRQIVLPIRPAYDGKFRPAGDVLNRLRWDQDMDSGDYIVGYEDRFAGPMERSVDSWKSETTHEEFIPEHRILYFKRKSDGMIVWDRAQRCDEIFGTGVTSRKRQAKG
ncbi:hypothetical protein F4804DRAFT_206636 [Jackrogersella minutella]|nr:hypothetical protein F4804DRAFT_206636 [Jackrogersella minutella]